MRMIIIFTISAGDAWLCISMHSYRPANPCGLTWRGVGGYPRARVSGPRWWLAPFLANGFQSPRTGEVGSPKTMFSPWLCAYICRDPGGSRVDGFRPSNQGKEWGCFG